MTRPIELYYWPTPNGWKITIALHEMELPYDLNLVNIGKGEQFRPEFLAISPNNRMPAIVDPEGPDGAADLGLRVRRDPAVPRRARPAGSTARASASGSRSRSGCSGRWAASGRWPARRTTSCATPRHGAAARAALRPGPLPQRGRRGSTACSTAGSPTGDFVAGAYSIADMAIWPWANGWENQQQDIDQLPAHGGLARAGRGAPGGARPAAAVRPGRAVAT